MQKLDRILLEDDILQVYGSNSGIINVVKGNG
jgi:hypothetical protein